jgi:hypothetical protein
MYFGKKFCKNCNSELKIQNKRDVIRKNFCSRTCNGIFNGKKRLEDTDFKIRFIESSQNKESRLKKGHRLEKHPLWKERKEICCIFCGSVFKVRENSKRKYCSKECSLKKIHTDLAGKNRIDRIKHECIICNKIFERSKNYKSPAKYCSRKCHCIGIVKFSNKVSTNIEKIIEEILISLDIKYQTQYPIENISVSDFKIDNLLIFADGDYWHNLPGRRDKDIIQTSKLKKLGYIVIRFDGSLIEKEPHVVKEKIMELL